MTDKIKPYVLVVEDDNHSQMLMNYYLRDKYEVEIVASVTEAKTKLPGKQIDIILLDLSLEGGEDGLDLARYIYEEGEWPNISIIATTAHAFTADRDNCIAAGCKDYISKPIKKNDLLAMMSKYVSS